jgi:hypothetical protein
MRDEKKLEAFKLLLDQNLPKPEYTQIMKVQKNFREFVKAPVDAVNDFMGALYRHAIAAIEEKHAQAYSEILAVKFVVSTPTGWPETVKSAILKVSRVYKGKERKRANCLLLGCKRCRSQSCDLYQRGRSSGMLQYEIYRGKERHTQGKRSFGSCLVIY